MLATNFQTIMSIYGADYFQAIQFYNHKVWLAVSTDFTHCQDIVLTPTKNKLAPTHFLYTKRNGETCTLQEMYDQFDVGREDDLDIARKQR